MVLPIYYEVMENLIIKNFYYKFNLIFSKFDRAKQSRRAMIKHQIETMLNIKGKDMPSVEEEFGSAGNIYILYQHINPIQTRAFILSINTLT